MLAEEIDLHEIFKINLTAMALFTADFDFIDANDEFLQATGRSLDEIVGRNVFEVLPKVPAESGNPKWTALEAALTSGRRERNRLTRYDIEDPEHRGAFRERYWSSVATPLRGVGGQVEVVEFSARDLTPIIDQFRSMESEDLSGRSWSARAIS